MPMNKTEEKSVAKISKSALLLLGAGALVLCLSFCLYLFGGEAELSEEEAAACNEILGTEYSASEYEDISSLVLPCVLLLKGKQACVLVAKNDNKKLVKIIISPSVKQQLLFE